MCLCHLRSVYAQCILILLNASTRCVALCVTRVLCCFGHCFLLLTDTAIDSYCHGTVQSPVHGGSTYLGEAMMDPVLVSCTGIGVIFRKVIGMQLAGAYLCLRWKLVCSLLCALCIRYLFCYSTFLLDVIWRNGVTWYCSRDLLSAKTRSGTLPTY